MTLHDRHRGPASITERRALGPTHTEYQQARLLARVRLAPGCTTRQLADAAGYDPVTVRRLLGALGPDLVERRKRSSMWVWYPASLLLLSHEERLVRALASAHGVEVAL